MIVQECGRQREGPSFAAKDHYAPRCLTRRLVRDRLHGLYPNFTSTRQPSRLRIDIRRSTMNRPKSALRMPRSRPPPCPRSHERRARSGALGRAPMIWPGWPSTAPRPRCPAPDRAKHSRLPAPGLAIPFSSQHHSLSKGSVIRSLSRFGALMPGIDFFWKAWMPTDFVG